MCIITFQRVAKSSQCTTFVTPSLINQNQHVRGVAVAIHNEFLTKFFTALACNLSFFLEKFWLCRKRQIVDSSMTVVVVSSTWRRISCKYAEGLSKTIWSISSSSYRVSFFSAPQFRFFPTSPSSSNRLTTLYTVEGSTFRLAPICS